MNMQGVYFLLGGLAEFQPQATDEVAARMWAETLDDGMTVEWALAFVTKHFASNSTPLRPVDLNKAWRDREAGAYWEKVRASTRELDHVGDAGYREEVTGALDKGRLDAHCGKKACLCTHAGGCYKGWMEGGRYDDGLAHPCPVCRGSLMTRLEQIPPPGQRTHADLASLRAVDADH